MDTLTCRASEKGKNLSKWQVLASHLKTFSHLIKIFVGEKLYQDRAELWLIGVSVVAGAQG